MTHKHDRFEEASGKRFLLVDGDNVIHALPPLQSLREQGGDVAQLELCRRLRVYRDASGDRVVVVFDGRAARTEEDREQEGLQIIRSGSSRTADEIIERLADRYASRYEITVVTNDRAEADCVAGLGAFVISADQLEALLDRADRSFDRWRRGT